jgi:hypothetical protein
LADTPGTMVEDEVEENGTVIQPLRRAHFWIWIVLGIALYAVFLAGLFGRRSATPINSNVHWERYR